MIKEINELYREKTEILEMKKILKNREKIEIREITQNDLHNSMTRDKRYQDSKARSVDLNDHEKTDKFLYRAFKKKLGNLEENLKEFDKIVYALTEHIKDYIELQGGKEEEEEALFIRLFSKAMDELLGKDLDELNQIREQPKIENEQNEEPKSMDTSFGESIDEVEIKVL